MALGTIRDRSALPTTPPVVRSTVFDFPELAAFPQVKRDFSTVIFDFDGTLANSMWVWDDIDQQFCDKYGLVLPETYIDDITAMSFEDTAVFFREVLGLNMPVDAICDEFNALAYERYAHEVLCKTGVKEYLDVLQNRGVGMAIATSLSWQLLDAALQSNGIESYFDDIAFCDECPCGKTQSDVYLLAAKRMGAKPEDCLVFEDIVPGLLSARRCGMTAGALIEERSQPDPAAVVGAADFVIASFEQLL